MPKDCTHHRIVMLLTGLLSLLLLLAGCTLPGSFSAGAQPPQEAAPPRETVPPKEEHRTIEEVQNEIDRTRQHIEDLREFETQQRQIGVINQVEHEKSRGWVKLDGHPTYEDLADQAYAQAAAAEKEITRLERKVSDLEGEKQGILSQSAGCFPADAMVRLAEGGLKAFQDIAPGDAVRTYDIGYDTVVGRPVVGYYRVEANHLYTINGDLVTTGGERLLTPDGWKKVRDIKAGDRIHVDGRMLPVTSVVYQRVERTLYNLQVADTHNFYVVTAGGASYLVHNTGGGGGGGK